MTDYRRFLGAAPATVTLPYFGGPFVEAADRRLRLAALVAPGFWRFEVTGRHARAVEAAEPPDLSALPTVRGYALREYLVHDARAERLGLAPDDEPLLFAPVIARRWPSGELLDATPDFEAGVEEEVREAYAARRPLTGLRGVPAALRCTYGYAVLLRLAGELGIPARPAEARPHLGALADEGDPAARRILHGFEQVRAAQPRPRYRGTARAGTFRAAAEERAATALHSAGAALRATRWIAGEVLEVRYDLDGEAFVSVVDGGSLNVLDAGVCLAGHDRVLTLDSLPGVIREAMATGELHVTAW